MNGEGFAYATWQRAEWPLTKGYSGGHSYSGCDICRDLWDRLQRARTSEPRP